VSFLELSTVLRRPEFTLDVSLSVGSGEVVALLGPNGAGKSTVLSVVAGLLRPDSGRVELDGRVLTELPGTSVPTHRRGVGLLAQQALLFPHLTASANVAFGPRCAGVARAEATATAQRWLDEVGVGALSRRRPGQLSGGQAQRVALARALAGDPKLLLLDEPLAALDIDSAPALRALLARVIRGSGRTALLVTHDVLDALTLADRVVVLTEGRIVEEGPTRDVLTRPRSPFAARVAGLNLVTGMLSAEGLRTEDGGTVYGLRPDSRLAGSPGSGSAAGSPGSGFVAGSVPGRGEPGVAVFRPASVAVFRERPDGSPRNVAPVRLAGLEPRGEVVRLRAAPDDGGPGWPDGLAADLTPAAVADLSGGGEPLAPGARLWFAVKAAEVEIHPAAR
jgi:molybdate transport system ATP-binding protein